jgi:hypothetical protein
MQRASFFWRLFMQEGTTHAHKRTLFPIPCTLLPSPLSTSTAHPNILPANFAVFRYLRPSSLLHVTQPPTWEKLLASTVRIPRRAAHRSQSRVLNKVLSTDIHGPLVGQAGCQIANSCWEVSYQYDRRKQTSSLGCLVEIYLAWLTEGFSFSFTASSTVFRYA